MSASRRPLVAAAALAVLLVVMAGVVMMSPRDGAHGQSQTHAANPFAAHRSWTAPYPAADAAVARLQAAGDTAAAARVRRVAAQPRGLWLDNPAAEPAPLREYVAALTRDAHAVDQVPVFVVYGIPERDITEGGNGGATDAAQYRGWVATIADGIAAGQGADAATRPGVAVILEPDALAQLGDVPAERRTERTTLLAQAVDLFAAVPGVSVYVDAGHSDWIPVEQMASRLLAAGVTRARGFALNVSNYGRTPAQVAYGTKLSARIGGAAFVVDTSRNGAGPDPAGGWCNPAGRAVGAAPAAGAQPPLDATLWIKPPAESDGQCTADQPVAGTFWAARAADMAARAGW